MLARSDNVEPDDTMPCGGGGLVLVAGVARRLVALRLV